jgi:hypothetical protein
LGFGRLALNAKTIFIFKNDLPLMIPNHSIFFYEKEHCMFYFVVCISEPFQISNNTTIDIKTGTFKPTENHA